MPKKTVKGMYCSPRLETSADSCYSKDQLLEIAKAYNKKYGSISKIDLSGNKKKLWNDIELNMLKYCDTEFCWNKHFEMNHLQDSFRPQRPLGKNRWLSTIDIRNVLKQYEAIYDDFLFLGPFPIDFCKVTNMEICNIDINKMIKLGKTKIGIVFNTDPSDKPGKHWISMFIDMSSRDRSQHEIGYFDSFGLAPLAPEIKTFIEYLKSQNPQFKLKLNCKDDVCTRSIRHQTDSSECGVYSINYIVTRLSGQSWEDIVLNNHKWTYEYMTGLRSVFFRPNNY